MSEPIRILHLSDFHFRQGDDWKSGPVLDGLACDVAGLTRAGLAPDVLALTGDIAFSGKTEEYSLARSWLEERLLPAAGKQSWDDVLLIPGNHDVDWNWISDEIRAEQEKVLDAASQDTVKALLENPERRERFLARHGGYLQFVGEIRGIGRRADVPWWSEVREIRSVKVGFVGLDSAWMSSGKRDQGQLVLGQFQVAPMLRQVNGTALTVALVHHPDGYLNDFDALEVMPLLRNRCRLILSGHRHRPDGVPYRPLGTDKECVELAAGAAFSGGQYENAYQLIEIDPETLGIRVHHRIWRYLAWRPNHDFGPNGVVTYPSRDVPVQTTGSSAVPPARLSNLYPLDTRFVGRQREINELTRLLCEQCVPVVTLLGAGGMGKTRLAWELGLRLRNRYPGGVWLADLTEARTVAGIVKQVMAAFGASPSGPQSPEETAANLLQYREPLLLILDNFEQVRQFAAATLRLWRGRAPHVQFLVTSRRTVPVDTYVYRLLPLPHPGGKRPGSSTDGSEQYDAVELFIDRAQSSGKAVGWTPNGSDTSAVARIVELVEGIPLAIQIAAARVRVMSLSEIAERLATRILDVLREPDAGESRHGAMTATIACSFDLLTPQQRSWFVRFGTFRGDFFLSDVEAVLQYASNSDGIAAIDLLHALIDASLLQTDETPYGNAFRMYVSVREYCEERWTANATLEQQIALEKAHSDHYLSLAEGWKKRVDSSQAVEALDRLEVMTENVMIAFERALERKEYQNAARSLLSLSPLWKVRSPGLDRIFRLEPVLENLSGIPKIEALTELSLAHQRCGNVENADRLAEAAVACTTELGDARECVDALHRYAERLMNGDRLEEAMVTLDQAESMAHTLSYDKGVCVNLSLRSRQCSKSHRFEDALRLCKEAEALAVQRGDLPSQAQLLDLHGGCLWWLGRYQEALEFHTQATETAARLSAATPIPFMGKADALKRLDQFDAAMQCYADAERIAQANGNKYDLATVLLHRSDALMYHGELEEAARQNQEGEVLWRELKLRHPLSVNLGNRAILLLKLGQLDEARKCAHEAAETLPRPSLAWHLDTASSSRPPWLGLKKRARITLRR